MWYDLKAIFLITLSYFPNTRISIVFLCCTVFIIILFIVYVEHCLALIPSLFKFIDFGTVLMFLMFGFSFIT